MSSYGERAPRFSVHFTPSEKYDTWDPSFIQLYFSELPRPRGSRFKCGSRGQEVPKTEHVDMTSVPEDTNESEGQESLAREQALSFAGIDDRGLERKLIHKDAVGLLQHLRSMCSDAVGLIWGQLVKILMVWSSDLLYETIRGFFRPVAAEGFGYEDFPAAPKGMLLIAQSSLQQHERST